MTVLLGEMSHDCGLQLWVGDKINLWWDSKQKTKEFTISWPAGILNLSLNIILKDVQNKLRERTQKNKLNPTLASAAFTELNRQQTYTSFHNSHLGQYTQRSHIWAKKQNKAGVIWYHLCFLQQSAFETFFTCLGYNFKRVLLPCWGC